MPGTKIKQEEDAQEAVQRMIHTDLFLHPDQLNMHRTVTSSETAVSPKYNINSKYLMSTAFATVNLDCVTHEFEWHTPTCPATPSLVRKIASCPPEERSAFEDLATCRGLLLRGEGGKVALYAWLSKATFAGFKTPKGHEVLRSWVAVHAHSFPLIGVGSFTL
uniref:Uncharacterized protein n=1 Tax=Alexandrium andersonii TaxID=327968 RepID=A0A7S2CXA7_9DINO